MDMSIAEIAGRNAILGGLPSGLGSILFRADTNPLPPLAYLPLARSGRFYDFFDEAGVEALIEGWSAGSAVLDRLLKQNLPRAHALRHFGLASWQSGNVRLAASIFAAATVLAPDDAALWGDLGSALQAIGHPAEARHCLERSLLIDPAPAQMWLSLALIAKEQDDICCAEAAFENALKRDPNRSDASLGLGLLQMEQRKYEAAAQHLRKAIATGCQNVMVNACLGQALYLLGDFSGAAKALGLQIASGHYNAKIIQRFALVRLIETLISRDVDSAIAVYRAAARIHAEDLAAVTATAFHALSGYGHIEAACRLGKARLDRYADDPIQRYLLDALSGAKLDRAPSDYLIAYFDRFAEGFDKQLVDVLDYKVPERLAGLVAATGHEISSALDLGCGTGLAASHLRGLCSRLVGVDLSPRMLDKARERGLYDAAIEAEMVAFLENTADRFELIFVADALIYLGDLGAFLRAAAKVLAAGGLLAFSVETTPSEPFALLPSGRFAHHFGWLLARSMPWFTLVASEEVPLRLEANVPVQGILVVLERRAATH